MSILGTERQRRRRRQQNVCAINAAISRLAIVHGSRQRAQQAHGSLVRQTVQLPLALQPLCPLQQYRHQLGQCNIICNDCQATHWIEERSRKGTREIPKFSACCMNGSISLPELPNAPTLMEELLIDRLDGNFYHNIDTNRYSWELISEEYSKLQQRSSLFISWSSNRPKCCGSIRNIHFQNPRRIGTPHWISFTSIWRDTSLCSNSHSRFNCYYTYRDTHRTSAWSVKRDSVTPVDIYVGSDQPIFPQFSNRTRASTGMRLHLFTSQDS